MNLGKDDQRPPYQDSSQIILDYVTLGGSEFNLEVELAERQETALQLPKPNLSKGKNVLNNGCVKPFIFDRPLLKTPEYQVSII